MKNIIILILTLFFTGCVSKNKSIDYQNTFFITTKNISLNKNDFYKISYNKSDYDINKYNIKLTLNSSGYEKFHELFKNSVGKKIGLKVNSKIVLFDVKIIDNFFEEPNVKHKKLTYQFNKEDAKLFLNSLDIDFKE